MAKLIVGITGVTGVGKSAVAVKLAHKLCCDVISADSMQIYKGMDVGTAKITQEEADGITHHMIDIVEPNENFSSFLYQQLASEIIDKTQGVALLVGGTGFYFDALMYPPEFDEGDKKDDVRKHFNEILEQEGLEPLVKLLQEKDAEICKSIDLCNPVRVIRALEICESGGKMSDGKGTSRNKKYDVNMFVLERQRSSTYEIIDKRVDVMIDNGLVDEVKKLVDKYGYLNNSAFNAIGYKEIAEYLKGNCTLEQAISNVKLNSRHYAKRQISYFKRFENAVHVDVTGKTTDEVVDVIYNKIVKLL